MTPAPAPAARRGGRTPDAGAWLPRLLRLLAVAIVVLAIVDPVLPSGREGSRLVAVLPVGEAGTAGGAGTEGEAEWVDRVAEHLGGAFAVTRGPYPGVHATVWVGRHLPAEVWEGMASPGAPVFLVRPPSRDTSLPLRLLSVEAPRRVPLGSRIPVRVWLDSGGRDSTVPLRATLRSGGVLLADTTVQGVDPAGGLELDVASPGAGVLPLRLEVTTALAPEGTVRDAGGTDPATGAAADLLVEVESRPWRVFFFEARPSWMTTFVRRALEEDPRFEIHSRTLTAPGLVTQAGEPPTDLTDSERLAFFDLVVVGAPEALDEGHVQVLEAFLRERGGSVALLPDREASGPHDRLGGVAGWSRGGSQDAEPLVPTGISPRGPGLEGRAWIWPSALPPGATAVATTRAGNPVVWQRPVGMGQLVVSGALDSWQFRDPETTGFEEFWTTLFAEAAARAPRPVEAGWLGTLAGRGRGAGASFGLARPGELLRFEVTLRAPPPPGTGVEVRARLQLEGSGEAGPDPGRVPLWPSGHPGRFEGWVRTPRAEGEHFLRIDLRSSEEGPGDVGEGAAGASEGWDETVRLPLVVTASASPPPSDDPGLLEAWVATRGGGVLEMGELSRLPEEIRATLGDPAPRDPWHPLRSPWWILPLALALAGEWSWRRRRGLA